MYAVRLGEERAMAAIPLRDMVDAGVRIVLGSDSPITPFGPWAAVRAAAWHHNPDQRLTVAEAVLPHRDDALGVAVMHALDGLRMPMRDLLKQRVANIYRDVPHENPGE